MREQSHKDEMASALRADFARLRARGIETTLAPQPSPAPSERAAVESAVVEPADAAIRGAPEATSSRPGWLARLRGR